MSLQPGQILDGKYRIVRVLGTGGMGSVYEGENARIHRRVAIKVLHTEVAKKADIVQRFEREAQAAGRIGSEHIVEVLDLGTLSSGERYMVMEFLEGESLTERIKAKGRLTPHETALILTQMLEGLGAAHAAGIIHRDIKPDNVFITKKADQDFVKLVDFGVSKFASGDEDMSMTKTGAVMGTPYYMSPEQARGQTVDQRSDLYAVGVVAYQCVTGRVPFNAETFNELLFKIALESAVPVEQVAPGIDANFGAVVRCAMERAPENRYQTAHQFAAAFEAWGRTLGITIPLGYQTLRTTGLNPIISAAYLTGQQPGVVAAVTPMGISQPGVIPGALPIHTPLSQSASAMMHASSSMMQSGAPLNQSGSMGGSFSRSQVTSSRRTNSILIALVAALAASAGVLAAIYVHEGEVPQAEASAAVQPAAPSATAATASAAPSDNAQASAAVTASADAPSVEPSADPTAEPSATELDPAPSASALPTSSGTRPGPMPTGSGRKPGTDPKGPNSGRTIDGTL